MGLAIKVMICGGCYEGDAKQSDIALFVKAFASQVIQQGHELRSGNISSLDRIAIEAACQKAEEMGLSAEKWVVSHIPRDAEPITIAGSVNESQSKDWSTVNGFRPRVPEPVEQAAVVVLVGGGTEAMGT